MAVQKAYVRWRPRELIQFTFVANSAAEMPTLMTAKQKLLA